MFGSIIGVRSEPKIKHCADEFITDVSRWNPNKSKLVLRPGDTHWELNDLVWRTGARAESSPQPAWEKLWGELGFPISHYLSIFSPSVQVHLAVLSFLTPTHRCELVALHFSAVQYGVCSVQLVRERWTWNICIKIDSLQMNHQFIS